MKMIIANLIFYIFLGVTAYFVTPYVLLLLIITQGFVERKDNK